MSLKPKQKQFIKNHYQQLSAEKIAAKISANRNEVIDFIRTLKAELSPVRKRLFTAITLLIPVLFFVILELSLGVFQYGGNLELFITAPGEYSDYWMCNPLVGKRYFSRQSTIPDPPNDLFLKKKPANGVRIFVLGGSTAAGYPFGDNVMFSRILNFWLSESFPRKHIEIINTSTAAINSYSLMDFTDEILEKAPDAILIYAGHNEFYGALGIASTETLGKYRPIVKLYLKLKQFRTFILVRDFVAQLQGLFSQSSVDAASATLMERLVGEQTIPYDGDLYEAGKRQFRKNLIDILRKTKKAGIPVVISEVVSNIRDQSPFVSAKAARLPPAEKIYQTAQSLEKEGQFDKAREKYYRAKDLDALRFRATEEFNEMIHQVAVAFGATVVPMKSYFEASSPHRLIGDNLMLDHLHPNIRGYLLMARAFYETLQHEDLLFNLDSISQTPSVIYEPYQGITELDSVYGALRIRILKGGWPFQPVSAPNRVFLNYRPTSKVESLAVEIWTDDQMTLERAHVRLAEVYEKQEQYYRAFREYQALIHLTPYNVSPRLRAAQMLIKLGHYNRALPFLYEALKLEESDYANKWIGQILLQQKRVQASIPFLEQAYKMNRSDPQLLYNLSGAYALNSQFIKARETLDILEKIYPDFPGVSNLKQQLNRITSN